MRSSAPKGFTGRIDPKLAHKTLQTHRNTIKAVWTKACEHDGIDPAASFIVFSEDNPFAKFVDAAQKNYQAALAEHQAGGYIGLTIG